jgi:hypothetical protein
MHNVSYCDVVRRQGTWRKVARWLTPVNLCEAAVTQACTAAGVHPRCDISYPSALSNCAEHDHRGERESRRTIADSELSELAI